MKSATEDRGRGAPAGASTLGDDPAGDDATMAELRSLLLGPAEQQLAEVHARLADPQRQLQEISRVLPAAVSVRTRQDDELTEALAPTVAQAIERSVRRNPQPLVDAIFPVMGPAIRRAIAAALSGMTQSLNQTLAHSFSVRGLKWRVEAWRTGRSFGEVVLLHTLLYRVEQVFLIHRETGLLLQHVVAPGAESQDADMVSAMLTAIQDFMRDSFKTPEGEQLEDIKIGERTLWVEQGPQAIMAAVVRGQAPRDLRVLFQETLERIHFQFGGALEAFSGDATAFAATRPLLEDCLQTELDPRAQEAASGRKLTPLITAGGLALAAVLVAGFFVLRGAWRWDSYLRRLQAEPGIVITEARRPLLFGKYSVRGLRDPRSRDPLTLLPESRIAPAAVISHWQPYQSMSPEFVLNRAQRLLAPPPTVRLTLDRGVLTATGFAPRQWAEDAQRAARFVEGVEQFRDEQLFDLERLEHPLLKFELNQVELSPGQGEQLQQLTADISRLLELARVMGKRVRIEITGRTDGSGTEERNEMLSRKRAEAVAAALAATLPPAPDLTVVPAGTRDKLREERSEADRAVNRSVRLKATLLDPE